MGFEPQIRTIIQVLPTTRQTMMFTATWPREVQALAQEFLKTPVEIKFGEGNVLNANKNITQIIKVITEQQKPAELQKTLEAINVGGDASNLPKTIVFVSRKDLCDSVAAGLWDKGCVIPSCCNQLSLMFLLQICSRYVARRQAAVQSHTHDGEI
jgi:ATP-dependent RNA helicase DDX5/DBP2